MARGVPEITVEELNAKRRRGEACVLVDVREPKEYAISDLPDSVKIPLGTLQRNFGSLSRDAEAASRVGRPDDGLLEEQ